MGDSAYSFSLTTFSPTGKLLQIENALTSINNRGKLSLGICATNGVVLATEKKGPPLIDVASFKKIEQITSNVGVVYAGMGPDYRVLLKQARKKALKYHRQYQEKIPVYEITKETATIMQEFTQQGGVRPFGVSLLIAGFDHEGPQLFQADPSGAFFGWKATAVGQGSTDAKAFLERRYNEEMELEDAIHTALLTMREGFDDEMTEHNIEVAIATADGFTVLTPAQVRDYLDEAQ